MNERIRELAEQAQKVVGYTDGGYTEIKALDQEKFAELIVRECADLNFCSTGHVTTDGEIAIGDMIRNHFGVEE